MIGLMRTATALLCELAVLATPIAAAILIMRDTWRSQLSQTRRLAACCVLAEAALLVAVYDLAVLQLSLGVV